MACGGTIGRNAKLYVKAGEINTSDVAWDLTGDGSGAYDTVAEQIALLESTDWKLVCAVDVERDGTKEKIDTSDRCSGIYKSYVPGQAEGTISFKAYKRKPITGTWLEVLRNAYKNDSVVSVLMLDDAPTVVGADGILANCNVFDLSESQPLNGPIEVNFELAVSGCTSYVPPIRDVTRPADP